MDHPFDFICFLRFFYVHFGEDSTMKKISLMIMIIIMFGVPACRKVPPVVTPPQPPPVPDSNPAVASLQSEVQEAPAVQAALSELQFNPATLHLPRSEESGYRCVGYFPLTDYLFSHPLTLPGFAENLAKQFQAADTPVELCREFDRGFDIRIPDLATGSRVIVTETESALQKRLDTILPELDQIMIQVQSDVERAFRNLTPDEQAWLREDIHRYFYSNGTLRFLTAPVSDQFRIYQLAVRVDYGLLFYARSRLIHMAEACVSQLLDLAGMLPPKPGEILVDREFVWGRLVIGGTGMNYHDKPAALVIDLGGDDVYLNNAGSNMGHNAGFLLDLSGNDTYQTRNNACQGARLYGCRVPCRSVRK